VDSFLTSLSSDLTCFSTSFMMYLSYHIWISRNEFLFNSVSYSPKMIVEKARASAMEFRGSTMRSLEI